jgi:peptidase E
MPGQIVALGGGGFSMEPDNPALDDFILSLAGSAKPRVCFIPTASADSPSYIARFYRAFAGRSTPTDLTVFDAPALARQPATTADLEAFVAEQQIFYVGGGNTAHLLSIWRVHGLDLLLRRAWEGGAIMAGISAGMLCWFQGGITDSFGGYRELNDGLALLPAMACPHYDGESARQQVFRAMVQERCVTGYAADDGAALHFVGTEYQEAISSRAGALAYRLTREGDAVTTTPLATRLLGS